MKRRICALLFCILMLTAGWVSAGENSVLRQDKSFSMQFDNLNTVETHAMNLHKGELLDVSAECRAGTLEITIKHNDGEVVYQLAGSSAPQTFLEIPRDGIYRINVSGRGAQGHVRITSSQGVQGGVTDDPYRLTRIQGSLGYMIGYDPDLFHLQTMDAGDFFFENNDQTVDVYDTYISLIRYRGSMESVMDTLMGQKNAQELPATMIDFRAARTVRYQSGDSPESKIVVNTVIEARQDELFIVSQNYSLDAESTIAVKMNEMVNSLQFLY